MVVTFIIVLLSIVGYFFNVHKRYEGYLLWMVTNMYWVIHNWMIGERCQSGLFIFYFIVTIYGFWKWYIEERQLKKYLDSNTIQQKIIKEPIASTKALVVSPGLREYFDFILKNKLDGREYRYAYLPQHFRGYTRVGIIFLKDWEYGFSAKDIDVETKQMIANGIGFEWRGINNE